MPTNFMAIDQGLPRFTGSESLEQRVKMLQDYQYQLVEQLRYALQNLDTRNMNMDAMGEWGGTLTEPLYASLMDEDGNMLSLAATAEGLSAQISDQNGKIAQISAEAEGISARLWDTETGDITQLQATAEGLSAQISDQNGKIAQISAEAEGISARLWDTETGDITQLQATAAGLAARISTAEGKASEAKLTADGFAVRVGNLEDNETLYLYVNRKGLIVSDEEGTVAIDGGQLIAGTVMADYLVGSEVLLKEDPDDKDKYACGGIVLNSASSADYAVELYSAGALRLMGYTGAVHLENNYGTSILIDGDDVQIDGELIPNKDEYYDLGSSDFWWNNVYASTCECCTSDRNKKNSIDYDLDAYERVFDALKPVSYKLNNGTSGRTHIGMIAQDVEESLCVCGMTGTDFAGLIKSPKNDGNGNIIEGEYVYGLRYGEFIGLLINQVQKLKSRVAELERSKA